MKGLNCLDERRPQLGLLSQTRAANLPCRHPHETHLRTRVHQRRSTRRRSRQRDQPGRTTAVLDQIRQLGILRMPVDHTRQAALPGPPRQREVSAQAADVPARAAKWFDMSVQGQQRVEDRGCHPLQPLETQPPRIKQRRQIRRPEGHTRRARQAVAVARLDDVTQWTRRDDTPHDSQRLTYCPPAVSTTS